MTPKYRDARYCPHHDNGVIWIHTQSNPLNDTESAQDERKEWWDTERVAAAKSLQLVHHLWTANRTSWSWLLCGDKGGVPVCSDTKVPCI